jgi:hypothetical protein
MIKHIVRVAAALLLLGADARVFAACTSTPIACGQTKTGTLSSNTCNFGGSGGVYSSYYFQGIAGESVDIFMDASTFRPQLALYGPAGGSPVAFDDFPGSTISYIHYVVPSSGVYTIAAAGYGAGQTSGSFELSLYCHSGCSAPVIVSQPSPAVVRPGDSVTLTVRADGTPPLHYSWHDLRNPGVTVGDDSPSINTGPVFSSTPFQATVSNACGSVDSNPAIVSVCDPPRIITAPAGGVVVPRSQWTFTVAVQGTTPLHYQWYEGVRGDTSKPAGSDTASLTYSNLTTGRTVWVHVANDCGSIDSDAATVVVSSQPPRHRVAAH